MSEREKLKKRARHGKTGTSEFMTWIAMKQRCLNPRCRKYKNYGARGIKICERWMKFENFLADMGERPTGKSLDRINNDGDYEPMNCRWATRIEQNQNSRNAKWITFNGETLTIGDWARKLGLGNCALSDRFNRGWSLEEALTRGPQPRGIKLHA